VSELFKEVSVAQFDFSWVVKILSLFTLPMADEDFAIILGGYFVVNELMPIGLVTLTIYVGMVVSDVALYGLGAAARRVAWLDRWAVNESVRNFGAALSRNLFELVALCRVVPGLDMVAFIACGWSRVPLNRFMMASVLVSALYLPLLLYLVVMFGGGLNDQIGLWAWPVLIAAMGGIGFVRYRIFTLGEEQPAMAVASQAPSRFRVYHARYRPAPEWRPRLRKLRAISRPPRLFKPR
jgi:membrane protein DedA with SNARE-associated domain